MNLTADPIPRLVRELAVPASIGFFFNTMFNVVDTWWAGRISTQAQAALSLSFPVFFILIATGSGLSQGATALIANALGSGRIAQARHYIAQSALLGAAAGIAMTLVGLWAAPTLFRLLGATDEYLGLSLAYMNTILGGSVVFLLQSVLNGGLQAQGDTKTYRNVLVAGCLLNVVLDPWLLYGGAGVPPMGIAGIALATVLITVGGTAYVAHRLLRTPLGEGLRAADFRPSARTFREIAVQGLPASLNMMTVALGIFVITWFVSRFSAKGSGRVRHRHAGGTDRPAAHHRVEHRHPHPVGAEPRRRPARPDPRSLAHRPALRTDPHGRRRRRSCWSSPRP
jgi:putative MATE family efflux protein